MVIVAQMFLLAFIPLSGIYSTVGITKKPWLWKHYLFFLVCTVFIISYSFDPLNECDLTRYFEAVKTVGSMSSIQDVLAYREDGLIVRNLAFWLIGKTGDVHLLPAISNSIVYGIAGYITCDSAQRDHFEKLIPPALLIQICLLQFYATTSNVRNICSFSLIILAVYLDIVKEEHSIRVALLYILPCFLHPSGIFLVLFRSAAGLIKNHMIIPVVAVSRCDKYILCESLALFLRWNRGFSKNSHRKSL